MKNIAYITGTRADFGLMSNILAGIRKSPTLNLRIYATGMHLMKQFGHTLTNVQKDYPDVIIINAIISDDSPEARNRYFIDCMFAVIHEFTKKRPDIALVLGDRAEMLAVACASLYLGIPVVHIQGGDVTGTVDDMTRNAITKLSHVHFPATKEAGVRIRRMNEETGRIYVVGSPSLDTILRKHLHSSRESYEYLGLRNRERYILLTFHPETVSRIETRKQIRVILETIGTFSLPVVAIYPNADPGSSEIIKALEYRRRNPLFHIYKSLDYTMFLSVARDAAVWIGNSSAGIIESPSLKVPVVNVGDRQKGRTRAKNIIDVPFKNQMIKKAIERSLTDKLYLRMIAHVRNPWGDGHTAEHIVKALVSTEIYETD